MHLKRFFLYFFFLFKLYACYSQTTDTKIILNNAYLAVNNIESLVYKLELSKKYLSRRDTVFVTALCSIQKTNIRNFKHKHYLEVLILEEDTKNYGIRKFDGKNSLWLNLSIDSLSAPQEPYIERNKRKIKSIVSNYADLLLDVYFFDKKRFKRLISVSDKILVSEEILKNQPVYVITIAYKDYEGIKDNVEKHYLRKSDFLPVAYSSFLKFENMEQYKYFEISYLQINNLNSVIHVDKNEIINPNNSFNEFQSKIKN